jgi:hypothetical protein
VNHRSLFLSGHSEIIFQMRSLTITMKWKWGGACTITCSASRTLEEIAEEHGFLGVSRTPPLFLSHGKILAPEFTLHAHKITDGQTIIVYLPRNAKPRLPGPFVPAVGSKFSMDREAQTLEDIEADETAKAVDMDFNNWECSRALPAVLSELLTMVEQQDEQQKTPIPKQRTVITEGTGISETPLPSLLCTDDTWMTICRLGACSFR